MIGRVQAAAAGGFPALTVVIAATHTHHGPDTLGLWGPNDRTRGVDEEYVALVKETVAATILQALAAMTPAAAIKTAGVPAPGFVKNLRDPAIIDDELTCLQFLASDDRPLATLMVFPCHPEVLWNQNTVITSDYPHSLHAEVEAQTGTPCLFFAGALGGMLSPDFADDACTFASAETMGRAVTRAGLQALAAAPRQPSTLSTALRVQQREIAVKLTNILYKLAFWRKLLPDTRNKQGEVESEVNLIQLNDLWLATVPGELLPKYGLQVKAQLHGPAPGSPGSLGWPTTNWATSSRSRISISVEPISAGQPLRGDQLHRQGHRPRVMEALQSMIS